MGSGGEHVIHGQTDAQKGGVESVLWVVVVAAGVSETMGGFMA